MKYFRIFEKQADALGVKDYTPTVAIVEGMNNVCFGNCKCSKDHIFIEDGDFIKINEGTKETRLVCVYNVTTTTEATQLLSTSISATNIIDSMEVDGTDIDVVNEYTFTTTGEHIVKYTLKDASTIYEFMFSACRTIISVDIPDNITIIGSSAFATCSLTSVTIGGGITQINQMAFMNCPITSFNYNGTMAQWKGITRGMRWHMNDTATTVTCTDGTCGLDDTTA